MIEPNHIADGRFNKGYQLADVTRTALQNA